MRNHENKWHNVRIHCNKVAMVDLMETYLDEKKTTTMKINKQQLFSFPRSIDRSIELIKRTNERTKREQGDAY